PPTQPPTLSLHDALPIWIGFPCHPRRYAQRREMIDEARVQAHAQVGVMSEIDEVEKQHHALRRCEIGKPRDSRRTPPSRIEKRDDRKSTRLNSSHEWISY